MPSSATMALARAFTRKHSKNNVQDSRPTREGSVRYLPGTINRQQISLPTELLSTTNVDALNAPDVRSISTSSSDGSVHSNHDSEFSRISQSFIHTPLTSAETSSIESSPATPDTSNDDDFFLLKRSATSAGNRSSGGMGTFDVPAIPQRSATHSKKAHQELARKRSISRLSPPPLSLPTTNIIRHSADFFTAASDTNHPFNNELAQVNEVAEEFGASASLLHDEEMMLERQGLMKFGVADYLDEISGLYGSVFEGRLGPMASPWI